MTKKLSVVEEWVLSMNSKQREEFYKKYQHIKPNGLAYIFEIGNKHINGDKKYLDLQYYLDTSQATVRSTVSRISKYSSSPERSPQCKYIGKSIPIKPNSLKPDKKTMIELRDDKTRRELLLFCRVASTEYARFRYQKDAILRCLIANLSQDDIEAHFKLAPEEKKAIVKMIQESQDPGPANKGFQIISRVPDFDNYTKDLTEFQTTQERYQEFTRKTNTPWHAPVYIPSQIPPKNAKALAIIQDEVMEENINQPNALISSNAIYISSSIVEHIDISSFCDSLLNILKLIFDSGKDLLFAEIQGLQPSEGIIPPTVLLQESHSGAMIVDDSIMEASKPKELYEDASWQRTGVYAYYALMNIAKVLNKPSNIHNLSGHRRNVRAMMLSNNTRALIQKCWSKILFNHPNRRLSLSALVEHNHDLILLEKHAE
jgi:hypothetical protein